MEEVKNRFYSLMVVGDNPDEMIKKYDSKLKVEPYIKYHYDDAGKLKKVLLSTNAKRRWIRW